MKGHQNLLIGIVLGALIAGTFVFLCLSLIAQNASFLLGFIACLVLVSSALVLVFVWNKNSFLYRFPDDRTATGDSGSVKKTAVYSWLFISILIVLGGLVSSFLIFRLDALFKTQAEYQRTSIAQQSELIESIRKRSLVYLMSNVLDKVDDELMNDPKRILSHETIARIAALSHALKPYTYFAGDSISEQKWSPERGQLLLTLSKMKIDSSAMDNIMLQASFSSADLREADLSGAYLKGVDLKGADLQGANLQGANLNKADLRTSNLWGANLSKADLRKADLKRTNLSWADLNGADLTGAELNGAQLISAKLRKANLSEAVVQWADLSGAFFDEANLSGVDFLETSLKRAHLSDANLSEAKLARTNLREANLSGAEMTGVVVPNKNWFSLLNKWQVTGAKEIQDGYQIVEDSTNNQSLYRLEKIKD